MDYIESSVCCYLVAVIHDLISFPLLILGIQVTWISSGHAAFLSPFSVSSISPLKSDIIKALFFALV